MLKKDVLELCLLHLIGAGEGYGYELLRRLHGAFPDTQESALYALIRGLHREGLIQASEERSVAGPPRKYYRMTQAGTQRLAEHLVKWRALTAALRDLGIGG